MSGPAPALPEWVGGAALQETWERVAHRLEHSGLHARGRTRVKVGDREHRHALSDLVGRDVAGQWCVVDLQSLDTRLRHRARISLLEAAEAVLARRLTDRPALQVEQLRRRGEPYALAAELLVGTHLEDLGWVAEWLNGLRRDGVLMRTSLPAAAVRGAIQVLLTVVPVGSLAASPPVRARTEAAADVLGDAHALDDDRLVSRLVQRALAHRLGFAYPEQASDREAIWESVGIEADLVSSTCLTLGLGWDGDSTTRAWRRLAAGPDPWHVTRWDLARRALTPVPGQLVLVCENPRVLQAHAETHGAARAVVCTSGRPRLVVLDVLRRLAAAGATLRYHGDFDWPGVAIANQLVWQLSVQPWLMSAGDYERAPGQLALEGAATEPMWDAALGASMQSRGVAIHEEAVLADLLAHEWDDR